jgi:hypothetical protein
MANVDVLEAEDVAEDEAVYGTAQTGGCMLGVLSGPLEPHYLSDLKTSRGGGPPVWCSTPKLKGPMVCALCKSPLYMVAQVYAPIDGDRALHIFGCNKPSCSIRRGSLFAKCFISRPQTSL